MNKIREIETMNDFMRYLRTLRVHGEWADNRLLSAIKSADADVPQAVRELAHVRGAQEIWLSRIERRPATMPVWPEFTLSQLESAGAAVDAAMAHYFHGLQQGTLNEMFSYTNSAGLAFTTPLAEILVHVLTHGQYHRGKVNVALRAAGITPVGVDYIAWQREQS